MAEQRFNGLNWDDDADEPSGGDPLPPEQVDALA